MLRLELRGLKEEKNMYTKYYYAGITFGTALAMTISFVENKSVLWAIIHGFLSWFYIIYYVLCIKN